MQKIKIRNGKVISILAEGDIVSPKVSNYLFIISPADKIVASMLSVTPLQLLAYYWCCKRL